MARCIPETLLERNEAIAWGTATGVWLVVLGLLLWLASRERRSMIRALLARSSSLGR